MLGGLVVLACMLSGKDGEGVKAGAKEVTAAQVTAEDAINVLILGTDRQAGLCDVMMIVNINFTKGKITVAQIPRDTYAKYTDGSYKKLNGAYNALGGAAQVRDFLEKAMGVEIDHYACVGLDTLCQVVDAIGGVDVDLPCDMRYSDAAQGLHIDLKKGVQHLDGRLAEQFVRFRSAYVEGDIGRIDAQKLFIAALFNKMAKEFSASLALKLATCAKNVETDLSASDMLSLGTRVTSVDRGSIALLTLPGEECVAKASGAWYYVLSSKAVARVMTEYFGAAGSFDVDRVFLNDVYEEFKDIYFGDADVSIVSVTQISENGIDIQIKSK